MQNNSRIEAGPCNQLSSKKLTETQMLALIDSINQVFTLFRLNYHNQYLKAFGNSEELNEVKRLWLEMLQKFAPNTILNAAKSVIESSEYLPTLRTMIYHCERSSSEHAFPEVHAAYIEACRAPSPKAAFAWSHPVVYYTGKRCDWYFLQSNPESVAYPIFRKTYEELCQEVRNGLDLTPPQVPSIESPKEMPLDRKTSQERLKTMRSTLEL